ncbi:MAG: MFS transporter [Janthinobacterium lividum]
MQARTATLESVAMNAADEAALVRKVGRRVLPFLILCFFVAFLDRVNVGFAALHMNRSLGFTPTVFGLGAGIFFIGYFLFEIPSNLALHRFGARVWISRIMISWGVLACACVLVRGETSFLVLRFLLGAAEAGFFPGVLLYMTYWFPAAARARVMSVFSLGSVVSLVIGSPLSGLVLSLGTRAGLENWQWLFLLEGLPSILLGVIAFFFLTDRPKDARWLSDRECRWLQDTISREQATIERPHHPLAALRDPRGLFLAGAAMLNIMAIYGVTMWLPQLVHSAGHLTDLQTGLVTSLPFLCTAVAMTVNGAHSDRTGDRKWHILLCALGGAAGFVLTALAASPVLGLLGLCLAAMGIWSSNTVFWTVPMRLFSGASAAASLALINSIGNLGGFLGPYFTGWIRSASGGYEAALLALGGALALFGVLMFAFLNSGDGKAGS